MTKEEYLQYLQNSEAFKKVDADFQKRIMSATGEKRKDYFNLLFLADRKLTEAKNEFITGTTNAVQNFKEAAQKTQKEFVIKIEIDVHNQEEKEAEQLITNI